MKKLPLLSLLVILGITGWLIAQDAPPVQPPAVPPAQPTQAAPPPVVVPAIPAMPVVTNRLTRSNRLALPSQFPRGTTPAATTTSPSAATNAIVPGVTVGAPPATTTPAAPATTSPASPVTPAFPPGAGQVAPGANVPRVGGPVPPLGTNTVVISETVMTNLTDGTTVRMQKFKNMPLEQFLEIYAKVSGRTILRPQNLPQVNVSFEPVTALTRQEIVQAYDTVLALNQITMIPTGEKFITAIQQQQAIQEGAAFNSLKAGQLPEASQFMTQIIQLKHVKPSEIATVLQEFAKSPKAIVAIDPTMTVVLRDYAINVKRMLEVIEKIDITVEDDYVFEVIPIRYGKVEEIFGSMSGLIGGSAGTTGQGGLAAQNALRQGMQQGLGRQQGGFGNRSRSGSGSGMYGGGGGNYGGGGAYGRYELQQAAPAATTGGASSFTGRLGAANRLAGGQGQGTFGVPQLIEDAQVFPDLRSNSLIVYASKKDLEQIKKVVAKVDTLLAQVLIEAIIMEVKLSDSLNFGVSVGQAPKNFGDTAVGGGSVNNPNDQLSAVSQFLSGAIGTNMTKFPTSSGLAYLARINEDWDVAVNAIATDGKANIVQRPRIQTSHGVPGMFFVGETVPFVSGSYAYGGAGYPGSTYVDRQQVGVQLTVTPFITPDDLVVMEVEQTIAAVTGSVDIGGGATAPVTSDRTAMATLSIRNGDTVLLGGYIQGTSDKGKSGVPVLKDLPFLGAIFSANRRTRNRTEMLVLMRPTILPNPVDAAHKAASERDSMPGIKSVDREWVETEKQLLDQVDGRANTRKSWSGKKPKSSTGPTTPSFNQNPLGTQVTPP